MILVLNKIMNWGITVILLQKIIARDGNGVSELG
jgi:hypothetical protein